jgi:hypothetical protein
MTRVKVAKNRYQGKLIFMGIKGLLLFHFLGKCNTLTCEYGKRLDNSGVVVDKVAIKIGKTKEELNIC